MMSAKRKSPVLESIPDIVARLHQHRGNLRARFTCAQLTRAVEKLRALCPGCDVRLFHAWEYGEVWTVFLIETPSQEAERLLGRDLLPEMPQRVRYFDQRQFGLEEIRRVAGGRILIRAKLTDNQDGPLASFTPSAIRSPVIRPKITLARWKQILRRRLISTFHHHGIPYMVARTLEFPIRPLKSFPEESETQEANRDFRLASADLERLSAMYRAGYEELARRLLAAVKEATVERTGESKLRLVVNNKTYSSCPSIDVPGVSTGWGPHRGRKTRRSTGTADLGGGRSQ